MNGGFEFFVMGFVAGVIIATFVIWIITGGNENGDH